MHTLAGALRLGTLLQSDMLRPLPCPARSNHVYSASEGSDMVIADVIHPNQTAAGQVANSTMQSSGTWNGSMPSMLHTVSNATQDVEQGETELLSAPAVVTAVGPVGHVRAESILSLVFPCI